MNYLVVDSPASFAEIIEDAISAADCVVLPVMPSPLDLIAQEGAAQIVARLGKTDRTLFVVNRISSRSSLGGKAFERVKRLSPTQPRSLAALITSDQ
jgi:cellulose biosynthesis protein BcsQ